MSDKNQNNDPLERFFRQKADEYDIQYKEEDWEKLEARLDEMDKQYANRRRRYMAAAVVLMLFAVLGYFTFEQQQTINQLNDRLDNAERENVADLPDNFFESLPDTRIDDESANNENTADETESDVTTESPDLASGEQSAVEGESNTTENSNEAIAADDDRQNYETNITESRLVAIANASPGFDGRSPAISAIKPIKTRAKVNKGGSKAQQAPLSESESDREFRGHQRMSGFSTGIPVEQQKSPRFSTGIYIGPDLSTVGSISNFVNPGHKIGLSVEYNITQNLALSVGAQHTRVRYSAGGGEYKLPEGYLPYGSAADEIRAQCVLIDIPVNLKYNFMHFNDSRIYASAGLSSYIMLNEDYQFKYENSQPQAPQRWQERTGTRHWMSNATISIGYEYDLMQNVSIRAEPFLKTPLKEVGWGNVNLYSMGSFFSINYKW